MIRRRASEPSAGEPPPDTVTSAYHSAQPGNRYVVEPCPGGGNRPVWAVVDTERKPLSRVVCRTSPADAKMMVKILNGVEELTFEVDRIASDAESCRRDYVDLVKSLWRAYTVYVSAGCTYGAFDRHVWPVIKDARRRIRYAGKPDAASSTPRASKTDLLLLADELKRKDEGNARLDREVADALGAQLRPYTTSIDAGLSLIDLDKYDYVLGSVNGQVGGTPYAQVGQHTCYSGTVPLALCAAILTALGSDPEFVYAVGYQTAVYGDSVSYGMVKGPTPSLDECLDFVPEDPDRDAVILEFESSPRGSSRVMARWHDPAVSRDGEVGSGWVKVDEK